MSSIDDGKFADLLAKVAQPVNQERLAAREAERTDPWRWYCRLCGAKGEATLAAARDDAAADHLRTTPCGRHEIHKTEESGRLLHVWSYPREAVSRFN